MNIKLPKNAIVYFFGKQGLVYFCPVRNFEVSFKMREVRFVPQLRTGNINSVRFNFANNKLLNLLVERKGKRDTQTNVGPLGLLKVEDSVA